jgi:hypothetical protein
VEDIYAQHKYRSTGEGATCAALRDGGCDIDSGTVCYLLFLRPPGGGNIIAGDDDVGVRVCWCWLCCL